MQKTAVENLSASAGADDIPIVSTATPANARQHKTAVRGLSILVVFVAIVMPFANIPLTQVDAFIPLVQGVICLANLLTATFLFAQYAVQPQRALLALASGFVLSGLFAFLQTLAFPDAYVPGVLIGDRLNSAGWLFVFWHTTFPLAVILYVLTKDVSGSGDRSTRSILNTIGITIALVLAITAGLTWTATTGAGRLPHLYGTATDQASFAIVANVFLTLLSAATIALLFIRGRTILDQWLIVTLFAWLPNFAVSVVFTVVRFSVGWYIARVYALLAGSSLLIVLLLETLLLYTRLAKAVRYQRVLVAELDHRVKNVLAEVEAVGTSTGQDSHSIADFVQSLRGRLQSMAAAHSLLSESAWQGVELDGLVRAELVPYTTSANIKISGTNVVLTPAQTKALGRVLHELATNAAKYGALSIPGGQVSVSWDRKVNRQGAAVIIEWHELGGPPVAFSAKSSYGTDLIRNLIPYELGGAVDLVFATEGVNCKIEVPLEEA